MLNLHRWSLLALIPLTAISFSCTAQPARPLKAPVAAGPLIFPRAFAPAQGITMPVEAPYRAELCLNGSWQFQPVAVPADFKRDQGRAPILGAPASTRWDKMPLKVPSSWNVNSFTEADGDGGDFRCYPSYPAAWKKVEMGWLRRAVSVPAAWKGQRLLLHFEAVAGEAVVFFNGHQVATNFDAFMPFESDVTQWAKFGGANEVTVGVRKAALFDDTRTTGRRPYPAGSFWGQAIAGIWGDVFLLARAPVRTDETVVQSQVAQNRLQVQVTVANDSDQPQTVSVGGQVQPWINDAPINDASASVLDAPEPRWHLGATVLSVPAQTVSIAARQRKTVTLAQTVNGQLKLWAPGTPNLSALVLNVTRGGKTVDRQMTRFGWRQFTFEGNRQLLNGKELELRGDSWHFMGIPQMSRRYAWAWYRALQNANGNAVRLHAQPYPPFYLDVADEMGVCVLDETSNWGSDGAHKYDTDDFWKRADDQVKRVGEAPTAITPRFLAGV